MLSENFQAIRRPIVRAPKAKSLTVRGQRSLPTNQEPVAICSGDKRFNRSERNSRRHHTPVSRWSKESGLIPISYFHSMTGWEVLISETFAVSLRLALTPLILRPVSQSQGIVMRGWGQVGVLYTGFMWRLWHRLHSLSVWWFCRTPIFWRCVNPVLILTVMKKEKRLTTCVWFSFLLT